jgi:rhodanese-related sulfurtransferase
VLPPNMTTVKTTNDAGKAERLRLFRYEVLLQIQVVLALSVALGFAFNAANPIGVRFAPQDGSPPAQTSTLQAASSVTPASNPAIMPTASSPPLAAVTPLAPNPTGKIPHISWAQVKPLLEAKKIILVDARPKVNYDHGHIPGAVNLPYSPNPKFSSTAEDFAAFESQYPKETPVAVYCTSITCQLSLIIAEKLVELGYTNVRKMNEGYLEYSEGLSESEKSSYNHSAAPQPTLTPPQSTSAPLAAAQPMLRNPARTSWSVVKPLLQAGKIVLVDVRQEPTYDLGHVPGAVNLSYTSQEDAFIEFQRKYPKDTHLVLYCTDVGCPLSMKMAEILVEKYGYLNVQHMTEGYAEVQRDELVAKNAPQ